MDFWSRKETDDRTVKGGVPSMVYTFCKTLYAPRCLKASADIGSGNDMTIRDYVNFLIKKLKLKVKIKYDNKKPDGVFRKVLDVSKINKLGWKAGTSLEEGLKKVYEDKFLDK